MIRRSRLFFGPVVRFFLAGTLLAAAGLALQPYRLARLLEADPDEDTRMAEESPEEFEYVFTRLAYYPPGFGNFRGHTWDTDYPKADRQFLEGVLRLTSIQARRQEQVLRPLDPDLFGFPFLYAVEVGYWHLTEPEAAQLREFLLRGGFLVVDDFHGTREWENFAREIRKVFPDRAIREVELSDPIFHCFYDIEEKVQVPGLQLLYSGRTYEQDGYTPHYRAIYDDNGRILVMINFNVDLGDAWEWADHPLYPEVYTSLAYRLGVNYIVYSMTH